MKLAELVDDFGELQNPDTADLEVNHITHDSRKVQFGSMFVALEGKEHDGHNYIAASCQMGAVCVLTHDPERVPCRMPIIRAAEPRKAMALMAQRLNDYPDRKLCVIGITGTNGKTTTTYLVNHLLRTLGRAGRIGTLSYFNGVSEEKSVRTTPESSEIYRCLGEMAANSCTYASLEISSHGLMLDRVLGISLRYALFTNLSQDHLDFHGDMETYFQAKHRQFEMLIPGGVAIINYDDEYGRRIKAPHHAQTIGYGEHPDADLRFETISLTVTGTEFDVFWQGQKVRFRIGLLGKHNIYNFVGALAIALKEGRSLEEVSDDHRDLPQVPGRMESVNQGQNFGVLIDFAHTPDALEKVMEACKSTDPNRLIVVFGAGGDRDHDKRPLMGQMVDRYADVLVLTSDNPRGETPEAIMDMVQEGVSRPLGETFFRDWDRREAIRTAINMARPGDLVVIAGKGHETTQEIRGVHHPFSDRMEAARAISARREG